MKKLISLLLTLVFLTLTLASCDSASGETPPGMKLLSDKDADGMLLYVPEQYTTFRDATTGMMIATLSKLDPTSISGYTVYPTETSIADYVAASFDPTDLGENAALVPLDPALGVSDYPLIQEIDGRDAMVYEWGFKRGDIEYRSMQVYLPRDAADLSKGVVILTYTGRMTASVTGLVAYTKHLEDFQKTLQVFSFTDGEPTPPSTTLPTPVDGMILASDPHLTNYSLFVPESYTLDLMIGITSAYDKSDRTSVSAFYAYPEGETVDDYIKDRLTKYQAFFDSCTMLTPPDALPTETEDDPPETMNNFFAFTVDGSRAYRYEFEASLDGTYYRFYEILIVRQKGLTKTGLYTVTMTVNGASESEAADRFEARRAELAAILDAFKFN